MVTLSNLTSFSSSRKNKSPARMVCIVTALCFGLVLFGGCASIASQDSEFQLKSIPSSETEKPKSPSTLAEYNEKFTEFFRARFGESAGVDPRARDVERRLGF